MPIKKDLKTLIRDRMTKTGESRGAARMHVPGSKPLPKNDVEPAGGGDEFVATTTGVATKDGRERSNTLAGRLEG